MPRTVTALYGTRDEAEVARISLSSDARVTSARVLAKDTAAALNGLSIDPKHGAVIRDALQGGAHLLVATVARGQQPRRIIDSLLKARAMNPVGQEERSGYGIDTAVAPEATETTQAPIPTPAPDRPEPVPEPRRPEPQAIAERRPEPVEERQPVPSPSAPPAVAERPSEPPPQADENLEFRAPARRLTEEEVLAGGLLRDRVIEVVEMREEPVIAREVVVREEVVIRKNANQQAETTMQRIRRTDAEAEKLS